MRSTRKLDQSMQAAPRQRRLAAGTGLVALAAAMAVILLVPAGNAGAAVATVNLGTGTSFSVLAGSGITNTGPSTVWGDVGTFPTPSETGFGSLTVGGTNHAGDAVTQQAKNDLTTAYNQAAGSGPATAVATDLAGLTLTPGVYNSPTLGLTGTLTLDTQGDPNAVFIFQAASTLVTASSSSVVVLNGAQACNVFWQIGSSATLGTASHLIGSVLAATSITATTGATIQGRLLAESGAVTLDTNTLTTNGCSTTVPTTTPPTTAPVTAGPTAAQVKTFNEALFTRFLLGLAHASRPKTPVTTNGSTTHGMTTTNLTTSGAPPTLAFTGFDPRIFYLGLMSLVLGPVIVGLPMIRPRRRPVE
jgi:hypothetical protein